MVAPSPVPRPGASCSYHPPPSSSTGRARGGRSRAAPSCRRVPGMRYGFYLPTRGRSAEPDALETLVARAETLGFHSTVIADHVVFPVTIASKYPYTVSGAFPGGGDALEQLTLMSFVAAKSTRLRLI